MHSKHFMYYIKYIRHFEVIFVLIFQHLTFHAQIVCLKAFLCQILSLKSFQCQFVCLNAFHDQIIGLKAIHGQITASTHFMLRSLASLHLMVRSLTRHFTVKCLRQGTSMIRLSVKNDCHY